MKTLADFKRALQVGTKWSAIHYPSGNSLGVREVGKVQSNSFAFKTLKGDLSYCDFPSAKDIEFLEDGTVNIWNSWSSNLGDTRQLMLGYKKVG